MPKPSKDHIEKIDADDPRNEWPTLVKVMAMTGLKRSSLENHVRSDTLQYVYDQHGERKFNPDSIKEITGLISDKEVDADLTKAVIEQQRKALNDMVRANADLLRLATVPTWRAMKLLRLENRSLRTSYDALQSKYLSSIDAFEKALSESHSREIERLKAEAREKRYDAGFNKLLEQVPAIISQLTFKRSIDGLLGSLTDEQKALLFDMLTPQQLQLLSRFMKQAGSTGSVAGPNQRDSDVPTGDGRTEEVER